MAKNGSWSGVVVAFVCIALLSSAAWLSCTAPCSWHQWDSQQSIPARCVKELTK